MTPDSGFVGRFWDAVNDFRPVLRLVFFLDLALLALTLLILLRGGLPMGAFVISVVNVVVLGGTLAAVGYALRRTGE
ncbi:hypothetical protein BRD03_13735 [Halobacteriales archaeon QS_9_68_17]|nr:MAG: hypothetical protein BRD03_13735 [Halobacteriales archaeon QS_9_68_17]